MIKWLEKVTNEGLPSIREKRILLNNIVCRDVHQIGYIPRRNYLHDVIEAHMMKVKGVGRKRTQFLNGLRNRKKYCMLKEKAKIEKCKEQFINESKGNIRVISGKFICLLTINIK